jgi:hypothetical protein
VEILFRPGGADEGFSHALLGIGGDRLDLHRRSIRVPQRPQLLHRRPEEGGRLPDARGHLRGVLPRSNPGHGDGAVEVLHNHPIGSRFAGDASGATRSHDCGPGRRSTPAGGPRPPY